MSTEVSTLDVVLRRDRKIVIAGLVAVVLAAWLYILGGAGMEMNDMSDMSAASSRTMLTIAPKWTPGYAAMMLAMWWAMMVAMMLPSAAPMVLLFAAVNRKSRQQGGACAPTAIFVGAYLAVWGGFSLAAVGLQWGLARLSLISPMMQVSSVYLGAALLVGAGLYQLTPLKYACLNRCRSPIDFLARRWRRGLTGAFGMGLEHGLFCLGCCWLLMLLLFYGGVMNLWWIAGLAIYVLVEKLAPAGHRFGRYAGALLIVCGLWLLVVPMTAV